MPGFVDDYECDPKLPHYGFKSWDDFFTRKFRPGRRPVASPDNNDIVANACESVPYKLAYGVKHRDFLWIKNQRYSMDFILNMSAEAKKFYGGTVYQGFCAPPVITGGTALSLASSTKQSLWMVPTTPKPTTSRTILHHRT